MSPTPRSGGSGFFRTCAPLLPVLSLLILSCSDGDSGTDPTDPTDPTPTAPTAPSLTVEVPKNGAVEAELRAENPDQLALTYEVVSGPDHGTLDIWEPAGDRVSLRYTPDAGFDGTDAVTYRIRAGELSDEGVVTLEVRNTAPVVEGTLVRRPSDGGVTVQLTATDADGDALEFGLGDEPGNGTVSGWTVMEQAPAGTSHATGTAIHPEPRIYMVELRYDPDAGFPGPDLFTVVASDGSDNSEPATVEVEVNQPPEIPVTGPSGAVQVEGGRGQDAEIEIVLVSPLGADLTVELTDAPAHGSLAPFTLTEITPATSAGGSATSASAGSTAGAASTSTAQDEHVRMFSGTTTYSPNSGFAGSDGFEFTVSDGLESTRGVVEVTITNTPPTAEASSATTQRGTPVTVDIQGSDPDGDPLTFEIVGGPNHGTLGPIDPGSTQAASVGTTTATTTATVLYTPGTNPERTSTFTYRVSDGLENSSPVEVVITLENTVPTALSQEAGLGRNQSVTLTLQGDDADGDGLTFLIAAGPQHGNLGALTYTAVAPLPGGGARTSATVAYTPDAGFAGSDRMVFSAHDGLDRSAPGEVLLTVTNQPPVATAPAPVTTPFETPVTISLGGTDGDGDNLLFILPEPGEAGYPANGSLGGLTPTGPASAMVVYTPDAGFSGADPFRFLVSDGLVGSEWAVVSLTVEADPNQPPVANAQTGAASVAAPKNGSVVIALTGSDPDGDPLTFTITGAPANGTITSGPTSTGPTSATVEYTPATGFDGTDQFQFTVSDGSLTSTSTVEVVVTNQPPVANAQTGAASVAAPKNGSVVIALTGSDPDGDPLTFTITGAPTNGAITSGPTSTGPSSATVEYTPTTGFEGADQFQFTVSDGGLTGSASVEVTVTNQPPVATDPGTRTTSMNTPVDVVLQGSDPDGDPITLEIVTPPTNGMLTGSWPAGTTSATYTYTPDPGYMGNDQFTFRFNDGTEPSNSVTVQIVQDNPSLTRAPTGTLTLFAGTGTPVTVTVTNSSATAPASSLSITPPVGTAVTVANDICTGATVAPMATCTFDLVPGAGVEAPATFIVAPTNGPGVAVEVEVVPATLTAINPISGSASGGTGVTLTGTNLSGVTGVTFDGIAATSVNVVNSTTVTAVTPAHAAGVVDVVIDTPAGAATLADGYTYLATAVGQPAFGGIIAALNGGLNNLIAATADNSTAIEWGGYGTAIGAGAQSTTDGAANTTAIVTTLGNNGGIPYAAQMCHAYEVDSQGNTPCQSGNACYNDWFLPAGDNSTATGQLHALFTNRVAIGGFGNARYWSSTEESPFLARSQVFGSSSGFDSWDTKSSSMRVRCVRNFNP